LIALPAAGMGVAAGFAGEKIAAGACSSSISRSVAPAARSRSPYTSPSTAVALARMAT
jgi:hypothetical protein